jgi:protein-tyrosine kinase
MVIERALEKLRQAGALQSAGGGPPVQPETRPPRDVRQAAPQPVLAQAIAGYPRVEVDPGAVAQHRIMIPGTSPDVNERAAAAYRMIRTRLRHLCRTENLQTFAITSPAADEGKSVTALNLALSAARDPSQTTFLLDLDLRNPSICKYLGVRPPRELVNYFRGEISAAEVFFTIGIPNLAIAGSCTPSEQASELMSAGELEALLIYIRGISSNPLVLIDLPPVLVTDEALLVAPRVDATLLVVAEGKTRRDSLERAQKILADFRCAGVILNGSTEPIESYYEYG